MNSLEFLFTVFDIAFPFWPFILLNAIRGRRNLIRNMFITWGFWAVVRILLFFNPKPLKFSLFIKEPLNTILFFACGVLLFALQYGEKLWQRGRLLQKAGKVNSPQDLLDLSPREFEDMVVELFTAYGHEAKRTGQVGDHGVDVIVQTKKGEKCVVQCKRWRGYVGEPVVRDFYGVVMHEKADKGIIITSGKFSRSAQEWAKGKPILLYDGEKFIELWRRAQARREPAQEPAH